MIGLLQTVMLAVACCTALSLQKHSCSACSLPGCRAQGMNLALPVGILHLAAFTMGYWLCKGLKFNEKTARTVSIETGRLTLVTRLTEQ